MNLFHYQTIGAEFLASRRIALLADEMRLGKSAQAIHAAGLVGAKDVVVVCPAGVKAVWHREIDRFSTNPDASWEVVSFNKIGGVSDRKFDLIVVDESHYLKNPNSIRTNGVYRVLKQSQRAWFLSGTPCPNNYSELWCFLTWAGRYKGTFDEFTKEFCTGYILNRRFCITGHRSHAAKAMRTMLDGVMLRRKLVEVWPELPPILIDTVPVEVDPEMLEDLQEQEELIEHVFDNATDPDYELPDVISLTTWRRLTGLAKVAGAVEVIKTTLEGGIKKVVVFAYHREVIEALSKEFPDFVVIHGGITLNKREEAIRRFRESDCHGFIGQITAAGVGIDLSVACEGILVEQDWVPGNNQQAVMRMSGVLQKLPVRMRVLYLEGRVDEVVTNTLARKMKDLIKIY